MSSASHSTAVPAFASDICNHCHRLDIPCLVNVGSRFCSACSRAKLRCRSARTHNDTSARFRERLSVLRAAINGVLNALDSVDLRESDVVISSGSLS